MNGKLQDCGGRSMQKNVPPNVFYSRLLSRVTSERCINGSYILTSLSLLSAAELEYLGNFLACWCDSVWRAPLNCHISVERKSVAERCSDKTSSLFGKLLSFTSISGSQRRSHRGLWLLILGLYSSRKSHQRAPRWSQSASPTNVRKNCRN